MSPHLLQILFPSQSLIPSFFSFLPMSKAEKIISNFYNSGGWDTNADGITADAELYEDLRSCSSDYVSQCRQRVMRYLPQVGDKLLDMASGPIQYPEYLEYSRGYDQRLCVDLSIDALTQAMDKLGYSGEYFHGNFLDFSCPSNFFDAAVSMHTIYHIDRFEQSIAIRKLIDLVKPGGAIVVVYSNPASLEMLIRKPFVVAKRFLRKLGVVFGSRKSQHSAVHANDLYFYIHKHSWWSQFSDVANISIHPWRTFGSQFQKIIIPSSPFAKPMFDLLFRLEDTFPLVFNKLALYNMIVLVKK